MRRRPSATALAAALSAAVLALGCSSAPAPTREPAAAEPAGGLSTTRLRTGMTAEEARSVAGDPASVDQHNCTTRQTVWRFGDGGVAILRNGRIAFHYP